MAPKITPRQRFELLVLLFGACILAPWLAILIPLIVLPMFWIHTASRVIGDGWNWARSGAPIYMNSFVCSVSLLVMFTCFIWTGLRISSYLSVGGMAGSPYRPTDVEHRELTTIGRWGVISMAAALVAYLVHRMRRRQS